MIGRRQRWAVSFADLCLLLLGFVLLLHARPDGGARLAAGMRGAMGDAIVHSVRAVDLFEPGEALLSPGGRALTADLARTAGGRQVTIASRGTDAGTRRLDGWELAAARTAALARALVAQGVAEGRISLSVEGAASPGQRLTVQAG